MQAGPWEEELDAGDGGDDDDDDDVRAIVCFNGIRELTTVSPTDHITFDSSSASISPPCVPSLKGLARYLIEKGFGRGRGGGGGGGDGDGGGDTLTVEGHTCSDGRVVHSPSPHPPAHLHVS